MLKGAPEPVDLEQRRDELLAASADALKELVTRFGEEAIEFLDHEAVVDISYPVTEYPHKVTSLNFDKTPVIEGTLLGIKGQYLILDTGVLNVRKFSGYHVDIELG